MERWMMEKGRQGGAWGGGGDCGGWWGSTSQPVRCWLVRLVGCIVWRSIYVCMYTRLHDEHASSTLTHPRGDKKKKNGM